MLELPQTRRLIRIIAAMVLLLSGAAPGQSVAPAAVPDERTRPARIRSGELAEFETLPQARQRLLGVALEVTWNSPWLRYVAGGAKPGDGGFDCSGAMHFVMREAGLEPPRSSGEQLEWLRKNGRLHSVDANARDLKHPSLAALKPGDLLFWAVTEPDGRVRVHHVAMFLGLEKKDGRPVMIGSTDGRSYRGQKADGYGVHDFRVPKADSASRLIGYGTPPGVGEE